MLESLSSTELAEYSAFGHKGTVSSAQYALQLAPTSLASKPGPPNSTKDTAHAAKGSLSDSNSKKRKRDESPSPESDKRACHSSGLSADLQRVLATHNDRPSPSPRNARSSSTQPYKINRCDPIPRPCAAPSAASDSTGFVSCYGIVKHNLSHFKACSCLFFVYAATPVFPFAEG